MTAVSNLRANLALATLAVAMLLGGCNVGSTSSTAPEPSTPVIVPTPVAASASVSVTTGQIQTSVAQGETTIVRLQGHWSGSNLAGRAVYLQVTDSAQTFTLPAARVASQGAFAFELDTRSSLATGVHRGYLGVRACFDSACSQVIGSSAVPAAYAVTVTSTSEPPPREEGHDWTTWQGDANHSGYVPVRLDVAKFKRLWTWQAPANHGVMELVSGSGAVFVASVAAQTAETAPTLTQLQALELDSGSVRWQVDTQLANAQPSSLAQGQIAVMGAGQLRYYAPSTGTLTHQVDLETGTPSYPMLAATPHQQALFAYINTYGATAARIDANASGARWNTGSGYLRGTTPAVDEQNVYLHDGRSLQVLDRDNGVLLSQVIDPDYTPPPGAGERLVRNPNGAPMLGSRGNVIARVGHYDHYTRPELRLASYSVLRNMREWISLGSYSVAPAHGNGVVYVASNRRGVFDALDERNGAHLWQWQPALPVAEGSFVHNVVLTQNLAFVSTQGAVYALDLQTRQPVWRYPASGSLSLAAGRVLLIRTTTSTGISDGRIIAIGLQ